MTKRLNFHRLKALWDRDRDPFLKHLRWGLHLRLLLIAAALSAGFLLRSLLSDGTWDLGVGLLASSFAWFFLRRFPAGNRWVVRGNLLLFVCLGIRGLWRHQTCYYPLELLPLMIMPVFGTLLDGALTGALVLGAGLAASVPWLDQYGKITSGDTLAVLFSLLSSLSLYLCCLAHTWLFISLVEQRRRSKEAVLATRTAVTSMAATLSDQIFSLTQRLRLNLEARGLDGLDAAKKLSATLKRARADRPSEIPQNPLIASRLLQDLRHRALSAFLGIASLLCALTCLVMLVTRSAEWPLAAGMTCLSFLLYRGSRLDQHWYFRLRLFVATALLTCLADVFLARSSPPPASLVFTPVIIFFAAMLDEPGVAIIACLAALGVLAGAAWTSLSDSHYLSVIVTLSFILPSLIAVSAATLPTYGALLEQLDEEEARLSVDLNIYRRLMSTFFHDLANPLSVLEALASFPPALQVPDDTQRAKRMAQRLEGVAQAARQALQGAAPTRSQATLVQLSDELYDLFRERLREKEIRWILGSGADLGLTQGGPLLRDSVLGNLLSNAVKFSPRGSSLELKAWKDDAFLHIQLSDTGRGIPLQVLDDLAQGRSPQSQDGTEGETGSGFGLLLAKSYMAELGGSLRLRARADGGTEAEVLLPLA
jgi:signal transduction histidine kinase